MTVSGVSPTKRPYYKRWWVWALAAFVLLTIIGSVSKATSKTPRASSNPTTTFINADDDVGNMAGPGSPTIAGPVVTSGSGQEPGQNACRSGNPLANVYHPNRLRLMQPCVTVSGVVKTVRQEDDGDVHFDIALDPLYTHLLTLANKTEQAGWLVVEIVPADEPGCTPGQPPKPATGSYNYGICSGADETPPARGRHVYVTGPYVLDEDHEGWAEVHPAWAIATSPSPATTTTSTTTTTTSPPPTTPPTEALPAPAPEGPPTTAPSPPPTSPPTTPPPPGAYCTATASPSNDGYPGDRDVYIHSNQPNTEASASDATNHWSDGTDSTGYVDIRLYYQSPGEVITVTVGPATCSATA